MNKKKTKIVIASVLKPVDDVRNYEKLACTLAKEKHYELFLMGTSSTQIGSLTHIHQLPWPDFKRLSIGRLIIQWRYLRQLRNVRPDLIIITTHELLITSVLYRLFSKSKLIYDVQEDYYRNLMYQHFYPKIFRIPLALLIRLSERICAPFITHFLLAEAVYVSDIPFVKKRFSIVDNKSLPIEKMPKSDTFKVVFTGTISTYSQALESIILYQKIAPAFKGSQLTVIGYCPSVSYRKKMETYASKTIHLKLSNRPIPHADIVEEIASADLAIIGYSPNPINERKVPTKQYEYTVARLPYLVRKGTHWSALGEQLGGAISIDFETTEPQEIVDKFNRLDTHLVNAAAADWKENEQILLDTIDAIISR